jgi:hypothetical protein
MYRSSSLMLCFNFISLLTQYVSYHPAITGLFLASVALDDFLFEFFNLKNSSRCCGTFGNWKNIGLAATRGLALATWCDVAVLDRRPENMWEYNIKMKDWECGLLCTL